ncbi:MAG: MarR family winged helix-turn-helix transcriptional regulator [Methylophilaceae bacterium]
MKENKNTLEFSECLCTSIRKSSRNISNIYKSFIKQSGLTINPNQVSILVSASLLDYPSISEISKNLSMERTTLLRNFNVMKNLGLIEIYATSGNRQKLAKLTKEGEDVLSKIYPFWKMAQNKVKEVMGDDLEKFQKNLKKVSTL